MIVIGAYVAGHSYSVPLVGYGGGSGQPSAEQEKKVDSGQDVDNASPMPQRMVLDSRMYCTDISLDSTIKSPGNDKTQNRRFSQYPENRRGHAEVSFVSFGCDRLFIICQHRESSSPSPNDIETCDASSTDFESKQRRIDRIRVTAHYRRDSLIFDLVSVDVEILSTRQSLSTFILSQKLETPSDLIRNNEYPNIVHREDSATYNLRERNDR